MPARLITAPALEPVTLDEAKAQLRLEHALDDANVDRLIIAARQHVEEVCWRGVVVQTWELVLQGFLGSDALELPGWTRRHFRLGEPIVLPMGQLNAETVPPVISVKYIDEAGVERTLATTEYTVDSVSTPGRILPAFGKCWPTTRDQWDAVRVQYKVGWAAAQVPEALKQAVLLLVSQMYEHRTPEVVGTIISAVQLSFDRLVAPYRLNRVG